MQPSSANTPATIAKAGTGTTGAIRKSATEVQSSLMPKIKHLLASPIILLLLFRRDT